MSPDRVWYSADLTCRPLETIKDVQAFLADPPVWRTLCESIRPHSDLCMRNSDLCRNYADITLEKIQTFCHYEPTKPVQRISRSLVPQTLVCHDMANGYHDDSAIEGTKNHNAYTFYNWAVVDIFCYFSHHLITIPPVSWINVAHAHGVKVIGTVITEWAAGAAFWDRVLGSDTEFNNMVSALVTIAKTLKFEGWLLNVENKISKPARLLKFVRELHTMLHQEIPGAVLIWYDSVTIHGDLVWQNKLDDKNKDFFDACDGIFTNYSWSEEDVGQSVHAAGDRLCDLYVGIDVWGRHFYGGGHFNTQKAVKFAHSLGCSLAIFAPAWTHEAMKPDIIHDPDPIVKGEHLQWVQRFLLRDRALWDSLWPFLSIKLPSSLPFKTSFCQGHGKKRRMYGEVLCNSPWYNLRHQQYQPNCAHGAHCYMLVTSATMAKAGRQITSAQCVHMIRDSEIDMQQGPSEDRSKRSSSSSPKSILSQRRLEPDCISESSLETSTRRPAAAARFWKWVKTTFDRAINHTITMPTLPRKKREGEELTEVEARPSRSLIQVEPPVQIKLGLSHRPKKQRLTLVYLEKESDCLEVYFEDCFNGGSCLRINPSDLTHTERRTVRLFFCDFLIKDILYVCMVTKQLAGHEAQYLNMRLLLQNVNTRYEKIVTLVGRHEREELASEQGAAGMSEGLSTAGGAGSQEVALWPLQPGTPEFLDMQTYVVLHEPSFYVPIANAFGWKVFYYRVQEPWYRVQQLKLRTALTQGPVLLGHVALCARAPF